MSRPLSAARQKYYKYRRFIRNTTAASILNYACVILYCVPLFAHAKGEEDHLASSQITIAGFAPQRNCILGSFSLALTQSAIMFSLPLKLQDDAGWCFCCCCLLFFLLCSSFCCPSNCQDEQQIWPQCPNCISKCNVHLLKCHRQTCWHTNGEFNIKGCTVADGDGGQGSFYAPSHAPNGQTRQWSASIRRALNRHHSICMMGVGGFGGGDGVAFLLRISRWNGRER